MQELWHSLSRSLKPTSVLCFTCKISFFMPLFVICDVIMADFHTVMKKDSELWSWLCCIQFCWSNTLTLYGKWGGCTGVWLKRRRPFIATSYSIQPSKLLSASVSVIVSFSFQLSNPQLYCFGSFSHFWRLLTMIKITTCEKKMFRYSSAWCFHT